MKEVDMCETCGCQSKPDDGEGKGEGSDEKDE